MIGLTDKFFSNIKFILESDSLFLNKNYPKMFFIFSKKNKKAANRLYNSFVKNISYFP